MRTEILAVGRWRGWERYGAGGIGPLSHTRAGRRSLTRGTYRPLQQATVPSRSARNSFPSPRRHAVEDGQGGEIGFGLGCAVLGRDGSQPHAPLAAEGGQGLVGVFEGQEPGRLFAGAGRKF